MPTCHTKPAGFAAALCGGTYSTCSSVPQSVLKHPCPMADIKPATCVTVCRSMITVVVARVFA